MFHSRITSGRFEVRNAWKARDWLSETTIFTFCDYGPVFQREFAKYPHCILMDALIAEILPLIRVLAFMVASAGETHWDLAYNIIEF